MPHFISIEDARQMTGRHRSQRENILATTYQGQNILAICESFDRAAFDRLLDQPGCAGIRVYYGMDEEYKVHAVFCGYDANGEDILPGSSSLHHEDDFEGVVEEGNRCPDICPPSSALNDDEPL